MTKELLQKGNEIDRNIFVWKSELERAEKTLEEVKAADPEDVEVSVGRRWGKDKLAIDGLNPAELIERKIATIKQKIEILENEFKALT